MTRDSRLTAEEIRRYGRHLVMPEVGEAGQRRLKEARVLVVGLGGLGAPVALYLAAAGVGTLGLADDDRVEVSNLQRQVLYGESDLGRAKVEAAIERLRDLNPHVELVGHESRLTVANAMEVLRPYEVVVDCSDNFPTRYLLNDACVLLGKPEIYGAIQRFEGQVGVFEGKSGACYRCLFDRPPPAGLVPSCAEGGVLGVLPGIVGSIQASETIKVLLDLGRSMRGRLLVFDALEMRIREIAVPKNPECPICSEAPRQTGLIDYEAFCAGPLAEVVNPREDEPAFDIEPEDLRRRLDSGAAPILLDVRTPQEFAIAHLSGTTLIPLQQLTERAHELQSDRELIVYCHTGQRSAHAVRWLRQQGFRRARNLAGGIDAWSLRVDPTVPRY